MKEFLRNVIKEDVSRGDLFTKVLTEELNMQIDSTAKIIAKSDATLAGVRYAKALCEKLSIAYEFSLNDGDTLEKGMQVASLRGDFCTLLEAERSILNIIAHASSIATKTRLLSKILENENVILLDTRKTRPLLRVFEKYAVRCGGGINHRLGLDDCLMMKDTHLAKIKNLKEFISKARKKIPFTSKIEVEITSFNMAEEILLSGADIVMCDNMKEDEIKEVVKLKNKIAPFVLLEASGDINEQNILAYARTGVNAISSGSIIHKAVWPDFSMKMDC